MSIRFGGSNNPFVRESNPFVNVAQPAINPLVGQALPTAIVPTVPATQGSYATRFGPVSLNQQQYVSPNLEKGASVSFAGFGGQKHEGRFIGMG